MRGATEAEILAWSKGHVRKPETLNLRTLKPEKEGLSCSQIFGPVDDYRCMCGENRSGTRCAKCGVESLPASVRNERLGHVVFPWPVVHPLFHGEGRPALAELLEIAPDDVEKIIAWKTHIVLRSDDDRVPVGTLIAAGQVDKALTDAFGGFEHDSGGRAIATLLNDQGSRFLLTCIPVLPPGLRPMLQLDEGKSQTHGTTDLYRRVINRSNRLTRLIELNAPEIILRNEARMIQEAVDALFENGTHRAPVTRPDKVALPSLRTLYEQAHGDLPNDLSSESLPDSPFVSALALVQEPQPDTEEFD